MKINREKLVGILSAIKPGLSKKAIVEQATHFIITGEEILTYNDQICIVYPFKTDFSCSIVAEEFYKILSGITNEEVDLSFKNDKLHIEALGLDAGLVVDTGLDILDMVDKLDIERMRKKTKSLPKDFLEAINLCIFSASKDATNPAYTCLLLEDQYIASTDGFRISEYKMKSSMDCSILVPAISVMELVKFKVVEMALAPKSSWVYFFTEDGICFCSRLVIADFPDYIRVLKGFDSTEIVFPKDLKRMIETASILAEGELNQDKEVGIRIEKGKFRVKGQNAKGWVESEKKFEYKEDPISFIINPFFLNKILDHTQSMFYGEGKILFKDTSFKHVISLGAK